MTGGEELRCPAVQSGTTKMCDWSGACGRACCNVHTTAACRQEERTPLAVMLGCTSPRCPPVNTPAAAGSKEA